MEQLDESDVSAGLWEALVGFWKVWVIHLGRRHHIFSFLCDMRQAVTPEEAAEKLHLNPKALSAWFDVAHALGLLRRSGTRYKLAPKLKELVVREDVPRFMGGLVSYYALRSLDFGGFDQLFVGDQGGLPHGGGYLTQAFAEGTKWDHTAFLKLLLPRQPLLRRRLKDGVTVLDLGCGSGGWIARLAEVFPKSSFLGVDPDREAIEQARGRCAGKPNVNFEVGRAEDLSQQGAFDIIYLGEVLYVIDKKEQVLKICYEALKPGGYLVVCEALMEDGGRTKLNPAEIIVRATQLEYMLQGGTLFKKSELVRLLKEASFNRCRGYDMSGGLWFYVCQKTEPNAA